jgi:predicted nucleic acid-binding protein
MIFVDSNILIDVLGEGQAWRDWSIEHLADLAVSRQLAVNQIAFAEIAPRLGSLQIFEKWLAAFRIDYVSLENDAAVAAGMAFQAYRSKRAGEGHVLPDFFIGGHALALGASILTREPRLYRTYFPSVPLITPSKEDHD